VQSATEQGYWCAGWVSYEASPGLDDHLVVRRYPDGDPFKDLPLVWFGVFERRVGVDPPDASPQPVGPCLEDWVPSISREDYHAGIDAVHGYIAAGDTYQVNYTMRLRSAFRADALTFYGDLARAQQAAYSCYVDAGRYRILSASPELFFRIDGRRILMRPMKGTIPRGRTVEEDRELVERLRGSIKDRAENAMIVDLLRNDLGRISETGSVSWPRLFTAERYETVWQLTSSIVSRLPEDAGFAEVFGALFPSGSITGAPKVRTMEIIAELETTPRGVYCGSIGWVAPTGTPGPRSMFNVAIRTVMLDTGSGTAEYGVGSGVTWDSRAGAEFDECIAKARVLSERRPAFELLETMRWDPGDGFAFLDEHLDRLEGSATYFGFCFDRDRCVRELEKAAESADPYEPARARLTLARFGSITVGWLPLPDHHVEPVRLAVDDDPVDPTSVFLYHKTTNRRAYQYRAGRHPGVDDVILVNDRGEITETTIANIVVKLDGAWWTPPVASGCLPGILRAGLLKEGRVSERSIRVEELSHAEAIALVNSVRGWREAGLVSSDRSVGKA
jgi:para-aminobenzoate synthetase/4-amino-4-deoxychorismate lyase